MIDTLAFRDYTKTLDCVVYGCKERVVPHHRVALGMGSKQRHKQDKRHLFTIPMCWIHHNEVHYGGAEKFEQTYGLNLAHENLRNLTNWLWNR